LTETAPLATTVHYRVERAGNIGVPVPASEIKLVPDAGKLEIRVRGPHVTPGYWRAAEKTAQAFDDEGFYRTGDAVRLADPENPAAGLLFDGRIGENFKLLSGTWVTVGALRIAAIAALAPVAEDLVITGHDRDQVGAMIFPNLAACRRLAAAGTDAPAAAALAAATVREVVAGGLARLNAAAIGTSGRIERALLLVEPPSADGNEITDKGYLNQRAILERRADLVARLYAEPVDGEVILPR
jgi:feruloyl-CoA synthase